MDPSPEIETLDQLLGGDMPVAVIRQVYPDSARFITGMMGLLAGGDIRLIEQAHNVPQWRRREVLMGDLSTATVTLTEAGARRVT